MLSSTPAHTDFVKSLLVIPQLDILLSGSSDKTIAIWSLSSLSSDASLNLPLTRLDQIKSHTRPVDSFALSHVDAEGRATVYAGDSMGVIRTWLFRRATGSSNADANKVQVTQGPDLPGHHTSITRLVMDGDQGLISCSMDSQVVYHPLDQDQNQDGAQTRNGPTIRPAILIPNPLYPETTPVRSLLLLPSTFHPSPLLLCGAADQDIRVYDLSSTLESASRSSQTHTAGEGRAKEVSRIKGHWADVIDLDVWVKEVEGGKKEAWVVSASLDETLRRWSMQGELPVVEMRNLLAGSVELITVWYGCLVDVLNPPPIPREEVVEKKESLMTAEEERELAELMDSDIEDDV
jgi:WD40 repeat protein